MNSCNNRPKWALSSFEPIYCMSFGCPFEIASAGIKEGRQSCYKTTCLVDYTLKKLSFVLSPVVILCCTIFIRVYHKAIYFLNNTLAFSFILQKYLILTFFLQIFILQKSYHQLQYILYMFCKMICPIQFPFLTISLQASYKRAFAGSGTFQILPSVSDHQIGACIFPDDLLHNFCLWTESV